MPRPAQDPSGKCPILLDEASLYRYDLPLPGSETRVDEQRKTGVCSILVLPNN